MSWLTGEWVDESGWMRVEESGWEWMRVPYTMGVERICKRVDESECG